MTKDDLIGIFRTAKNNYRLVYILLVQTSQDDVMSDFIYLYQHIDSKLKVIDGIEPLILDKNVLKIAIDQFHMTILRAIVKELFEIVKIYCKSTGQNDLLHSQDWYQVWRIIRNCFSHDFHFRFNNYDKQFLPILWKGIEIREDMDGKKITTGHFSYEKMWVLVNEVEGFIKNTLA
jgi:hypothetical protein